MNTKRFERLDETLHTWTHRSGLRVLMVRKEGYQKKTAVFATNYGSVDNRFKKPGDSQDTEVPDGIAHFLEHKLFEQKEGNVLDRFSKLGASPNAFTSFHQTAYHFTCTERFDENLKLLLHFVQHPWLTDENVEKEKGIIAQEIKMYDDNADFRVFFNLLACLYREHPVRLDIAGTVESISGITKDMLMDCWRTFYNPSNMVLAVVGDVSPELVVEMVESSILQQEPQGCIDKVYPKEAPGVAKEYHEQRLAVSMPLFMMGIRDDVRVSGSDLLKRHIALEIALDAFAGRSSSLFNRLYEAGLVNESFGTDVMLVPAFGFVSFGGQSPEPEQVAGEIKLELSALVENGLPEESFLRVKRAHEGLFIRSLDETGRLARDLCDAAFADACHLDLASIYAEMTLVYVNGIVREVLCAPHALSVVRPHASQEEKEMTS